MNCFSVDVCIYSTCAFLTVMLILMYAFTVFVLFILFYYCQLAADVDNVQRHELVTLYGV